MTAHPYSMLIRLKQWADQGLHETIARNFERLDAQDAAIVPLVLDHIHAVDRIFQHHLQGLPHGFHGPRSAAFDEPVDFVFTSGKPARMTRGEILLHVCLHGTYHRGNAGVLLQKAGGSSYPDGVTDFLEAAA